MAASRTPSEARMAVRRPGASGGPHTSVTGPGDDVLEGVAVPALAADSAAVAVAGSPPRAGDPATEPRHPATDKAKTTATMIADVARKAMQAPPRLSWYWLHYVCFDIVSVA